MTDVSYQATSGNKYASYDKYGLSTYRLLSLQNERAIATKYLETNSITQVKLETQQTAVDSIRSALIDIRSQIRDFYAADLTAMSKDPSEEELLSLRNVQEAAFEAMSLIAHYLNTEIDGNYIFGGGRTNVPPVDFSYTTLEDFQNVYDGDILTYSTSQSASLSKMASSADTLGGVTIEQEVLTIKQPFDYIGSPTNTMTFSASSLTSEPGTFTGLVAGDRVAVTGTAGNDQTLTVTSVSDDGSLITFAERVNSETVENPAGVKLTKTYAASVSNPMTFAASSLKANAGTFTGLTAGDVVTVAGTTGNNNTLTVTSVSADGSLITFEEAVSYEDIGDSSTVTLTTVPGGDVYGGNDENPMTFNDSAKMLTANEDTFTGLVPGDEITIAGTAGNNLALTVNSVSADGSTIVFNEAVSNEASVSTAAFTKSYSGSPTGEMTFDQAAKVLMANTGTFTGLEKGDVITVAGTAGNNQTFTVASVSADGDFVTFEERVSSETISDSSGVKINQAAQRISQTTDYVGSATNEMEFISDFSKLTANAGTFTGLVAGDVVALTGTEGNNQTLIIHSVSADGSTVEFEFTGTEEITDEILKNSSSVELTKTYAASALNQMTFVSASRSLTANAAGTFTGLAVGDQIAVGGTSDNNKVLTVASVAADGSSVTFEEDVDDEGPLATAVFTKAYRGADTNTMTFVSPGALTADRGTFSGLAAGDQVVITGTGSMGNDQTMIVASVSDDGSTVRFTRPVSAQTISNSENVKVQQGTWKFESTFDPTTGITTNSLTGRAGAFSDLKPGKQVLIGGTNDNNHIMTVQSVSKDGSTVFFEEDVINESLNTVDLLNGTANGFVSIKQSTQTGKITAAKNIGEEIDTFVVNDFITVDNNAHTLTGAAGAFEGLTGGQTITLADSSVPSQEYTLYIKSVSADGSTLTYSDSATGSPDIPPAGTLNSTPLKITTYNDIGGFVTSSLKGSALQTGDVSFNLNQNSMTATVKGAFAQYSTGDSLIIKGADSNDKMYIVESVSEDGRTVKFSKETPVVTEMNAHSGSTIINGEGLTICKTYSVGATVEMTGTNASRNGLYTVLGVSDDGREITVRTESFPEFETSEFFSLAAFETESYYRGGHLESGYRISETTQIADDINASASAFEKIFRALGNIAQGNLLDAENPESAGQRVSEALDLLDKALTVNPNSKSSDITSIQYAVITRLDQVKTTVENQTELQNSMETYISALTQVDKTEAVTMLLQASENLKASYSVLSTMNSLSLLNYL